MQEKEFQTPEVQTKHLREIIEKGSELLPTLNKLNSLSSNYLYKGKVLFDLRKIIGSLQCIPTNISPDKDKGIYLKKALETVKSIIKKYEGV